MALFNKRDLLESAGLTSFSGSHTRNILEASAREALSNAANEFRSWKDYDIFLSHSYADRVVIESLSKKLIAFGHTVYVDWIDDSQLDRSKVTKETASTLRTRMKSCRSLFYATSDNANKSNWMPWELGYFDALKGRVAILPIIDDENSSFFGREYLGLYPYVDKTERHLWINESFGKHVSFNDWLSGLNP